MTLKRSAKEFERSATVTIELQLSNRIGNLKAMKSDKTAERGVLSSLELCITYSMYDALCLMLCYV